jgi:hypothetical protein
LVFATFVVENKIGGVIMAKKEFNKESVLKQIADLELKIQKLTLAKQTLELALQSHERKANESNK